MNSGSWQARWVWLVGSSGSWRSPVPSVLGLLQAREKRSGKRWRPPWSTSSAARRASHRRRSPVSPSSAWVCTWEPGGALRDEGAMAPPKSNHRSPRSICTRRSAVMPGRGCLDDSSQRLTTRHSASVMSETELEVRSGRPPRCRTAREAVTRRWQRVGLPARGCGSLQQQGLLVLGWDSTPKLPKGPASMRQSARDHPIRSPVRPDHLRDR